MNRVLLPLLCLFSLFGKVFPDLGSVVESERRVLLEFKASVSDPVGILSSWVSSNGSNHCDWFGVSCDGNSRVTAIRVGGVGGNFTNGYCFDVSRLPLYGLGFRRRCGGGKIRGKLIGGLSPGIARLKRLRVLSLPFHELSGEIPSEIWGLESLEVFDLEGNLILGELPDLITGMRNLRVLNLGLNRIGGVIPDSVMRLVSLEVLNLAGNELEGVIPEFVGRLRRLRGLYLSLNRLKGEIPDVWGSNCVNLMFLDLSGNGLRGKVPPSLGECRRLEVVVLFSNALEGDIPHEFGRLRKLRVLDVSRNRLGGYIPAQLGNCRDLSVVVLSYYGDSIRVSHEAYEHGEKNLFRGSIPIEILALAKLKIIWAPKAGLEGELLGSWGCCQSLVIVNLSQNSLSFGSSNGNFEGCKSLVYADLSSNKQFPRHIDTLQNCAMKRFNVGKVPGFASTECFSFPSRVSDSLQDNGALSAYLSFFVGRACSGTSSFLSKVQLYGDKNIAHVQRDVRKYVNARLLSEFSPSSDQTVPSSSLQSGAEDLQAGAQSPSRNGSDNSDNKFNSIEIASIVSASVIVLVLLALVILFIYTRKCAPRDSSRIQVYERKEIRVFNNIEVPLTYQNVVKATDCFSAGNCIGCGGFGATYKAEVSSGVVVAVKRLAVGRFHCIQQFHAEIKTLGRIKHPNLVTLIGYHASETEMFLIYNYLPGGNLEKFIQERAAKAIKWKVLHKIALDIAHAIAYLHDECNPRVIHRDVKPSNILLDNQFNAYLSDFGLSRLLENSETHATTGVAGTFGYLAPEYAMTCRVSEKADVYSYGVVLLELISDKKALDPSFSSHGNGFNIVSWAHMLLRQGRAKEVFTAGIWDSGPRDDLVEVLHLAVKCTVDSLSIRPTMKQVVELLKQVQPLS